MKRNRQERINRYDLKVLKDSNSRLIEVAFYLSGVLDATEQYNAIGKFHLSALYTISDEIQHLIQTCDILKDE